MIDLISGNDPFAARQHFEAHGHVGIDGAYPAELAQHVVPEVLGAGWKFHATEGVPMGQTANIYGLGALEQTSPGLKELVDAVGEHAANLGRNLWPVAPDDTPLLEVLRMPAGTEGPLHTDKPYLKEAVAITTLTSSSELLLPDDDGKYLLVPGVSVFLDPSRQLPHKAIAGAEGHRVALAQSVMKKKRRAQ